MACNVEMASTPLSRVTPIGEMASGARRVCFGHLRASLCFRSGSVSFIQLHAVIIMRAVDLVVAPCLAGILVPTTDEQLVVGEIKMLDDLQVKAKKEDA